MAKKGGQIQLQVEVNSNDDWAKLLEREGLIVVDVYSDWCGPCSAMSGNLKKIKLDVGGDFLHLAMAKSNHIADLARFRDRSEPTWMFIAGGKMVNLMFGANSPKLQQAILDELKKEEGVRDGSREREEAAITSLSPEEQARFDEVAREKEEQEAKEEAARQKARAERFDAIVTAVATAPQQLWGLLLVFPFAHDRLDQLAEIWETRKQGNSEKVQLKDVNLEDMLFYTPYRFKPEVLEQAEAGNCIVYLAKNDDADVDIDEELLRMVYGESMAPPGDEGSIADRLLTPYVRPKGDDAGVEVEEAHAEEEEEQEEIMLDGIWVPGDRRTRHLAMFTFFPNVVGAHVPPEPEPVPPHVAVVFDAWKKNDVLAAAEEYQKEVLRMGFFTDERPAVAKLICKTPAAYARRIADKDEKLVLQLSKKHSDVILAFAQIGPTYMSINSIDGAKDCERFFPEGYDAGEEVSITTRTRRRAPDGTSIATEGDAETFMEGLAAGDDLDYLDEEEEEEGSEEGEEEAEEEEDEGESEDLTESTGFDPDMPDVPIPADPPS